MKDKNQHLHFFDPAVEQQLKGIAYKTVPLIGWFVLIALIAIVLGIVAWSILGTVEVNIEGKGIVLNEKGIYAIQTPLKGILQTLYIQPGDHVKKGDLVAKVYDAEKEILLKTTKVKIDALAREVNRLTNQVEKERLASVQSLESQLISLDFDIKKLNERIEFLTFEHKKKLDLYKQGLIILNIVQETEREIEDTKTSIEEKKGEIADIRSKLTKSYRTEELKTKELDLLKAREELKVIKGSLNLTNIKSPYDGKILEILVNPGEIVTEGQALINAEYTVPSDDLIFYGYFSSELVKQVKRGDIMRMSLSTVNENEFGSILSRVEDISDYAISEKAVFNLMHNSYLARYLTENKPVTQIISIPLRDSKDPSGYAWTSGKGPTINLSTGMVGIVEVTIEEIHPIYYLFHLKEFKKTSLTSRL